MQTASTNICERLCNKSFHEISLLLNIPRSNVSGIITKWKQLGTSAAQPRSGRPRKMTEQGQLMLKHTVHKLSAESIAKYLQTSCGLQISTTTVRRELMELVSMAEQQHPSHTSPSANAK
ncbi:unnamed protein product [Staurois parvus]|uniref:Transposase Tc1-like domain-containing protein n=1 Tax=Staurois parvus TaxID=386267 RepID=A0ABN9ETW9_9NEOB|nr:unnamed protein product [Staurois parvus]